MSHIYVGLGANNERQLPHLGRANRHGLIAGATGTGKTVMLQTIEEQFSENGVPVFLADVKGDLSGISMSGSHDAKNAAILEGRARDIGTTDYAYHDNPAIYWELYGQQGHPIRTTISEMGPLLLARLMVSTLQDDGSPSVVQRTLVAPPCSRLGPVTDKERAIFQSISPCAGKYDTLVNRESAAEVLAQKAQDAAQLAEQARTEGQATIQAQPRKSSNIWSRVASNVAGAVAASAGAMVAAEISGRKSQASPGASAASAAAGTIGTELGKMVGFPGLGRFARGLLGRLLR
jgi:DNA helicase HerA-like ATPase